MTNRFLPPRRNLARALVAGLLTLLGVCAGTAQAQPATAFPSRPVTLITAFPPGSGPDAVLRLTAERLSRLWGQPVSIDNRPGGAGFIAFEAARRAAPDGHTLLQLDSEHLAAVPHLYKSRGFDTLKVFEPVAVIFRTPFLLAVGTDSKWKTVADLTAAAKAAPDKVSFGSWGVGSPGHLGGEQLELLTGTSMVHVPFRETAQLFGSVGSGEVAWSFGSIPSSQGVFRAGKLRYLAVAAARRIPQMPEVPTMAEAGGPAGMEVNSFVVLVAPRGVPATTAQRIHADMQKVLADPEVKTRLESFAFEILSWTPAEIEAQAAQKSRTYAELFRRKNISLD